MQTLYCWWNVILVERDDIYLELLRNVPTRKEYVCDTWNFHKTTLNWRNTSRFIQLDRTWTLRRNNACCVFEALLKKYYFVEYCDLIAKKYLLRSSVLLVAKNGKRKAWICWLNQTRDCISFSAKERRGAFIFWGMWTCHSVVVWKRLCNIYEDRVSALSKISYSFCSAFELWFLHRFSLGSKNRDAANLYDKDVLMFNSTKQFHKIKSNLRTRARN